MAGGLRCPAIGRPIIPNPMKPRFMRVPLRDAIIGGDDESTSSRKMPAFPRPLHSQASVDGGREILFCQARWQLERCGPNGSTFDFRDGLLDIRLSVIICNHIKRNSGKSEP